MNKNLNNFKSKKIISPKSYLVLRMGKHYKLDPIAEVDKMIENFEIKRYSVDSTIISVVNQIDVLTDEFSNFYECVTSATILTENGFTAIR